MGPTDLSRFWEGTIEQLKKTEMRASVDESPEQCGREFKTYQVAMDSFQGRRIRAWYSVPNDPPPNGQFPRYWRFRATAALSPYRLTLF